MAQLYRVLRDLQAMRAATDATEHRPQEHIELDHHHVTALALPARRTDDSGHL